MAILLRPINLLLHLTVLSIPILVWWQSMANPAIYFSHQLPPGQIHYVISKLIGLYAILFIWLQILVAVYAQKSTGKLIPKITPKRHLWLGCMTMLFSVLHASMFIWGVSLRSGHFASHLLWPDFLGGFYNFAVALGVIGLWSVMLVAISGYKRKSSPRKGFWRLAHKLSVVAFLLVFLHSFLIGTESRIGIMFYFYVGMAAVLLCVLLHRLHGLVQGSKQLSLSNKQIGESR